VEEEGLAKYRVGDANRNGIELERCGQVRATKPESGSGPVECERYYMLGEIYLGQMGKIK